MRRMVRVIHVQSVSELLLDTEKGTGDLQVSGVVPNQLQNSSDHALLSTELC